MKVTEGYFPGGRGLLEPPYMSSRPKNTYLMSSRVNLFFKYLLEPSYHLEKLKLPLSLFLISNTIHIGINIFKSMWFEYVMCLSEMFLGPETQFSSKSCLSSSLFNLFNVKNREMLNKTLPLLIRMVQSCWSVTIVTRS